jgi:hypothetical protein
VEVKMSGKEVTHNKGRNNTKKIVGCLKEICGTYTRLGSTVRKLGGADTSGRQ